MWTKEDLQNFIKEKMADRKVVVVSNRQPYVHNLIKGKIACARGAGGVISALDPIMRACGGLWVCVGSGDADRKVADAKGRVKVPPGSKSDTYTLKYMWLNKEENKGYYYGYSNEALWPLCHMAFQRPSFRADDWDHYRKVNKKFAEAIIDEIGTSKAFVWIQDYHLALLASYLKELSPNIITAHFWHIPWPNYETFRICPNRREILKGLLYNDLLGFHIRHHCDNFLEVIDRELESRIDREKFAVIRKKHATLIRPYPISVDFDGINLVSKSKEVSGAMNALGEEFHLDGMKVILGLDRIDYTKGIPERMFAVDRMLEKNPKLKEKVVFIQVGEMSRIHIPRYKELNDRLNKLVEEINWKHSTDAWDPIIFTRRHLSYHEIIALYRLADVCVVSSLHDGMNLVAKEFVSSRSDTDGMLVLSRFTGSARELTDAVLINPYDREETSNGISEALNMPKEKRSRKMKKMRQVIKNKNIYRWAGKIISEVLKLDFRE